MAITDPAPFVPDTSADTSSSDKWGGQGPAMAASGNIGGLMQALTGNAPQTPAAPTGVLSRDQIDSVTRSMAARIRTPEQLQQGKEDRRSAFEQMKQANLANAEDDWSPQRYMALGQMEGQLLKPWDAGSTAAHGTMRAYEAELAQMQAMKQAKLDNAKGELAFQQGEEKGDDANEKGVMSDYGKIVAAQAKIDAAQARIKSMINNPLLRFKDINGSLVDLMGGGFDAQGNPIPQVKFASSKLLELKEKAYKDAQAAALQPGMNFAPSADGKLTAAQVQEKWIEDTANRKISTILMGTIGSGPSLLVPGSVAAPQAASTAPGAATSQAATGDPAATAPIAAPGRPAAPMQNAFTSGKATSTAPAAPGGAVTNGNIRASAGVGDIPPEMATPTYLARLDEELKRPGLNQEQLTALQTERQRVAAQLASGGAPTVKPGTAPIGTPQLPPTKNDGVTLLDNSTQAAQTAGAKKVADDVAANYQKMYGNAADLATKTIPQMKNLSQLADQFTPGAFDNWKSTGANVLNSLGFDNATISSWKNIGQAGKAIQGIVNDRVRLENGRQTDDDARRIASAMPSVIDSPESFRFAVNLAREMAERDVVIARKLSPLVQSPDYQSGKKILADAALDAGKTAGPGFIQVQQPDAKGKPANVNKFRHQFVEETLNDPRNANKDPDVVRAAAEKRWNEMAKQRGLR